MEKIVDGNVISVPVVDLRVELIFFVIPYDGDDWDPYISFSSPTIDTEMRS